MSSLQKQFAKAKLSGLPFDPPDPPEVSASSHSEAYSGNLPEVQAEDDVENEDVLRPLPQPRSIGGDFTGLEPTSGGTEDDSSSASSASSTSSVGSVGTIRPEPRRGRFARVGMGNGEDSSVSTLAPLSWTSYFAQEFYLTSSATSFIHHVYLTLPTTATSPLFVLHHGAGCSALSFAACAAEIKKRAPDVGFLAIDARGHGETVLKEGKDDSSGQSEEKSGKLDMSLEKLGNDLEVVLEMTKEKMGWDEVPGLMLIGHSLGGAVVTHVAKGGRLGSKVLGFAVLDVVEGSAMDALKSMNSYLDTRPDSFRSLEMGIDWHIRSRTLRNLSSARISVPSILTPVFEPPPSPQHALNQAPLPSISDNATNSPLLPSMLPPPMDTTPKPQFWNWRTDLTATSDYWENWFGGMSSKFLSARGGKLLLLAGTDRLDKELMIGQMQGKYQLQVFPDAGHFIQEDLPEKTASVLVDFWKRNDGHLVLPPKVSALMAEKGKVAGVNSRLGHDIGTQEKVEEK